MSTLAELSQAPSSKKIYIAEIDINRLLPFAVNWRAGCWMLNMDVYYPADPEIASWFLSGVSAITITRVGSMTSDDELLQLVDSAADVQDNELSFFWDQVAKNLYFRLQNWDRWNLHQVMIGEVLGVTNFEKDYNDFPYDGRLKKFPGIDRTKDPLFFGRLSYPGGRIEIDNEDGEFDTFCEDRDVVKAVCRVKQGFKGLDYSEFIQTSEGFAEKYSVGPEIFGVDFRDRRASLDKKIPTAVFDKTTYPNLKDGNVGKSIPIAYGVLRNVPVICTNEEETTPTSYAFKICDTTYHAIEAIDKVYVEGVEKTPASTNLTNATFTLSTSDYSPGDKVTADVQGYTKTGLNILYNPGCEKSDAPHIKGDGIYPKNCTVDQNNDCAYSGNSSFKLTKTNAAGSECYFSIVSSVDSSNMHGLTAGKTYRFKARVKVPSVGGPPPEQVRIYIYEYYDSSWHDYEDSASLQDQFEQLDTGNIILNAATTGVTVRILLTGVAEMGDFIYFDDVEFIAVDDPWLIENPLDVIEDLLTTHYPINYNDNYFDTSEWEAAKLLSSDVHYYTGKPAEIEKVIEEICNSTFLGLIPLADGRYTARYYNPSRVTSQIIYRDEVMETPTIEYDSTQMLRYVRVGYDRDWAEDDFKYYPYDSEDVRVDRSKTFETLLTSETDALAFAQTVILLTGDEYKPFDVKLKLQALQREVMDFVEVEIWRPRKKMLGWVKAEVLGIHQEPEDAGMTLNCRVVEVLPE